MTITVSNLGKRFNREWIFHGLTTEFTEGKIYAITGPNGSGKSTLMQVLWGQIPASVGKAQYQVDGKLIPVEEVFKHITIATPYMELMEEFTLQEQVDFHFKFKTPSEDLNSVQIIEKMELSRAIHKPIKQFSSGMKQRIKLGLALFSASKAVFLDEPTTNLDHHSADWYRQLLAAVTPNKTIIIATNEDSDYPAGSIILNLTDFKRVTPLPA